MDFEIQTDYLISARRPDQVIVKKKKQKTKKRKKEERKITCRIVVLAVPADHRVKLKESEKKDKYQHLATELKKKERWNMKVTVIPIVIDVLGTITEGLVQGLEDLEIRGQVEIIQTTASLRSARILRRVLETWGNLLSLKLQWKTID